MPPCPHGEEDRRQDRGTHELLHGHPQDLAREQVLELLAAVRIVREQQDLCRGGEHEQHADQRLLHLRALALRPGEQQRAEQRGRDRGDLRHPAVKLQPGGFRRDHAERGNLCDREIDEHDATPQHLLAERHVRQRDEDAGDERRPQDAEGAGEVVHLPAASSRLMVSSKSPNRSLASGVPPTENGSTTTGTPIFRDSESAAFASL